MVTRFVACLFVVVLLVPTTGCRSGNESRSIKVNMKREKSIEAVQRDHTEEWMSIPGVIGTAIGLEGNEKVIKVLVVSLNDEIKNRVPDAVEGYRVVIEETGEMKALTPGSD